MLTLHYLSLLIVTAALCAWVNQRFLKLPSAIGIMSVSLGVSLALLALEWTGVVSATKVASLVAACNFQELVLHGMLAFLLFAGGLTVDIGQLRTQKAAVTLLSSVGVVLGACITGAIFWWLASACGFDVPFEVALLFGAIVAPTDAVAILGILRKVGVPKSLELKLVGESLFNDGIGVVVFLAVSSMVFGEALSVSHMGVALVIEIVGGASLGALLGSLVYKMIKAVDEYVVEILLTLALATGGYALAETLHVSAPICVVVAGLLIGNRGRERAMSERTREHLDIFWELVDELLNAALFVLIGLELLVLSLSQQFVVVGVLAVIAMLCSRFLTVGLTVLSLKPFRSFSPHVIKILTWGGLRGGISVALALSLPPGEKREFLLVCTYVAVLFSVLVQGGTLPVLLRYAKKATT